MIADFSEVRVEEIGPDRVRVTGGKGAPKTGLLKTSVGYVDSYVGEGQISYAGPNAVARARLALDIVRERLALTGVRTTETRFDLIGVDSLHGAARIAGRRPLRSARFASSAAPTASPRRSGSARRSRRSTPTGPPPAAAPGNRRGRSSPWPPRSFPRTAVRTAVTMLEA